METRSIKLEVGFWGVGETGEKPRSRVESKQTQPTYDAKSENRTRGPHFCSVRWELSPLRHPCISTKKSEDDLLLDFQLQTHKDIYEFTGIVGSLIHKRPEISVEQKNIKKKAENSCNKETRHIQSIRCGTRFGEQLQTLIIIIEINFCNGANLRSFAIFIAMFSPSAHWVVEVVLIKVCVVLILKRLHQRVKGLRAHIWNVKGFRRFVFYQPIRFVHQVCIR